MPTPHYWNPHQIERLLDALATLDKRQARTAALIMWRTGTRISETLALEWRDIDLQTHTLLVRQGKGGRTRTIPLHDDLSALFQNWPTPHRPHDPIVGLPLRTALRHIRQGMEEAKLDAESPGMSLRLAGAHSLRHSAARHWLTTANVPLNVVSQWLGHANPQVTLRVYLPIIGSNYTMANVP